MQTKSIHYLRLFFIVLLLFKCHRNVYDLMITREEHMKLAHKDIEIDQNDPVKSVNFGFIIDDLEFEKRKLLYSLNKVISQKQNEAIKNSAYRVILRNHQHKFEIVPHYYILTLLTGGIYAIAGGPILEEKLETEWEVINLKNQKVYYPNLFCRNQHNIYDRKESIEIGENNQPLDYGDYCRDFILGSLANEIISFD